MRYSPLWLVLATGCVERQRPYQVAEPEVAHPIARIELRRPALPGKTLRAPHRDAGAPYTLRSPLDLRSLIGRRDRRPPIALALAWSAELGAPLIPGTTGADVVAWARSHDRLVAPTEPPEPGDLLVFDRTESDAPADLIAVAIGREGDVIEFAYGGGGIVRRGFADPRRPAMRRDATGASVNTFMRSGKRWPPKHTHYLAGELLAYVVHVR